MAGYLHITKTDGAMVDTIKRARTTYTNWEKRASVNPDGLTKIGLTNKQYFAALRQQGKPPSVADFKRRIASGNAGKIGGNNVIGVTAHFRSVYGNTDAAVRKGIRAQKENLARKIPSLRGTLKKIGVGEFAKINWNDKNIEQLVYAPISPPDAENATPETMSEYEAEGDAIAEYMKEEYFKDLF